MQPESLIALAAIPLTPLLLGACHRWAAPRLAARVALGGLALVFFAALFGATSFVRGGAADVVLWRSEAAPWADLTLRLDLLSVTMVLLVSFLGWVVTRFSINYLAGDPRQGRFLSWMSLTLASVLTLVMAGTLGLMLVSWVATSLTLHRLLLFFPERPGAVFAARKKFVVSRLGDLSLLIALVWLYRHYGTTELSALFSLAAAGDIAPLPGVGFLLITCAILKSAQFPFHSWLPDTMETPTPVSALMHAGIVNAGGFLMLRLSPIMIHAPAALTTLAIVGGVTAAFGAVVMLAQPSVKRALAYSTVAQMGFMLLQCGVGAFGLALLHIVAHSLYKAHSFLRAGSTIGATPRAAIPLQTGSLGWGALGAGLLMAGGATALRVLAPGTPSTPLLFGVVVALGLAYGIARIASAGGGRAATLGGIAMIVAIAAGSFALHSAAQIMFASFPTHHAPGVLLTLLAAGFIGLFVFQALLWRADQNEWGRRLHVHALNGFYIGTFANRALNRLWPRPQFA